MKVTLRKRKLKTGGTSLYLDIYHNGKREYESLSLSLVPPKNSIDRKSNRETLLVAEALKAERQIQLQNGTYGFTRVLSGDKDFLAFFKKLCEERAESVNNYGNWISTYFKTR